MTIDHVAGADTGIFGARRPAETPRLSFHFNGEGSEFFVITLVNAILGFLTLGIWYAWGRVKELKFLVGHVVCGGDPMSFHGRGGELLRGVLIAFFAFIVPIFGLFFLAGRLANEWTFPLTLLSYLLVITLVVFASVGSLRYRLPRTEWRGIRFGFDGSAKEFVFEYVPRQVAVFLTLGLAYPYVACWRRQWVLSHCRYGDAHFACEAEPGELYPSFIAAWLLMPFTLGWSLLWFHGHLQAYLWNRSRLGDARITTDITGGGWVKTLFINMLLTTITFGIAAPWAIVRLHRYFFDHLSIENTAALRAIHAQAQQTGAVGEGLLDALSTDSGLDLG